MPIGTAETASPILEIALFGGCRITVEGKPLPSPRYRKEWWLLALLALRGGREISRESLAAEFWPESEPERARLYLRRSLTNLRQALGSQSYRLQSPSPRTLRLNLDGASVDAFAFDTWIKAAHDSPDVDQEKLLKQAVELYRGELLPDCVDEWALAERVSRFQVYCDALETLATRAGARSDTAAAAIWLRRLIADDPYRESAAAALMQILANSGDRATATQVYQELRRRYRDDLNTAPSPALEQIYHRLSERKEPAESASEPVASASATGPKRRLPIPLTDLLGREQEVAEVTGWLEQARLLTLLGTGGVGKTRLAIASAEHALPNFSSGVWFVDLAPVTEPSRVAEAAARALGIAEQPGASPEERLAEALSASSLLIVLDNCEHVLGTSAALASHLLSSCPDLRILATSRQALGVPGEQVYSVPPLTAPPESEVVSGVLANSDSGEKNAQALLEYPAARLFVERARRANPEFRLTRRNAGAVAELCRRLDGIPLALELAAARIRALTAPEIAARLDERFRLLVAGNRAAAPRHQTLQAAIDWSYDLLDEPERALLRRVAIFAGGWRLEATERIYSDLAEPGSVLNALSSLVDKSMVAARADSSGEGGTRYTILETVRQYARERLRESGEEEDAARRHARWALALAEGAEPELSGADAASWLNRLESEHDNFRAALDWLAAQPGAEREHLRLAGALSMFWVARGHYYAGRQLLQTALSHADSGSKLTEHADGCELRAKAVRGAAILASSQGDYPAAQSLFEEALALRRRIGAPAGIANAINNLGTVIWLQGDLKAARELYAESLALYRQLGDKRGTASALYNIAILAYDAAVEDEDFGPIRPVLEEAAAHFRELNDDRNRAHALNALGNLFIDLKNYPAAQRIHEQNLALASALGDPLLIADAQAMLAIALGSQGELAPAYSLLREALARRLEMGDKRNGCIALRAAASLLSSDGRGLLAAKLLGTIEKVAEEDSSQVLNTRQQAEYDRSVARAQRSSDPAHFAAAWQAGRALTWQQAVEQARAEMG